MHRRIALITAALITLAGSAAADDDEFGRTGLYVGAGAGIGTATGYSDRAEALFGLQTRVDAAVGADLRIGWRALPWLAAEGFFEWLPGFDVLTASDDPRFPAGLLDDGKIINGSTWMASANLKAFLRHDERFQPFVEVGFGYMQTESVVLETVTLDASGYATRMGGGIDCHIDRHWLISIDVVYVLPTGSAADFDYVAAGVGAQYRF